MPDKKRKSGDGYIPSRMRNDDNADDESEPTQDTEHSREDDGRSIEIDTGFYRVQVWGDTDDSFDETMDKALEAADRAKADAVELDDRIEDNGREFR